MRDLVARNPHQPEFHQAVQEFAEVLLPFVSDHPRYRERALLERITEPERIISSRVLWADEKDRSTATVAGACSSTAVDTIVVHNGDSAAKNVTTWQCASRFPSAHYAIDRDGKIYQYIGEERQAFHAGGATDPRSIGIELQIKRKYGTSCNSSSSEAPRRSGPSTV